MTLLHADLPIADDGSNRFLPVMVAVMVFLAALTMAGAFATGGIIGQWTRDATGTLTVQIVPPTAPEGLDRAEATRETDLRLDAALDLLRDQPAVARAEAIPMERLKALMEPWLGTPDLVADLPIPRLIDVTLKPGASLDLPTLAGELDQIAPDSSIDDHRLWLSKLVDLARGLGRLSWVVVALVTAATSLAVIEATRSGLATHRPVIEVLHLIGAHDDFIARQFARRALVLGMVGGSLGLGLALPAILGIGYLSRGIEGGFVPDITLAPIHWLVLAALPAAAGVVAMITTRLTVLRALASML